MHDESTGLIYNRARHLHPGIGRFLQRDPLSYINGMSTYAYYAAMHGAVDPLGLCCKEGACQVHILSMQVTDVSIKGNDTLNLTNPEKNATTIRKILKRPNMATPLVLSVVIASSKTINQIRITSDVKIKYNLKKCNECDPTCPPGYKRLEPYGNDYDMEVDHDSGLLGLEGHYDIQDPLDRQKLGAEIVEEFNKYMTGGTGPFASDMISSYVESIKKNHDCK